MDELQPLIDEAAERGCGDLVARVIAVFISRDARNGWIDGMNDATKAKVRARSAAADAAACTDAAAGYGIATRG